jgi:hypothetical protein
MKEELDKGIEIQGRKKLCTTKFKSFTEQLEISASHLQKVTAWTKSEGCIMYLANLRLTIWHMFEYICLP